VAHAYSVLLPASAGSQAFATANWSVRS